MEPSQITLVGLAVAAIELLGLIAAVHAVMRARTSQGAIAWVVGLASFPVVALPLYLVFGRSKFHGYVRARRAGTSDLHRLIDEVGARAAEQHLVADRPHPRHAVLESLAAMRFTLNNRVKLLIDGEATFGAIFEAIDSADDYIVVQFFIVKDDRLGRALKSRLADKAASGVRVYFLYDEIGSHRLPRAYLDELREAGVDIRSFHTTRGRRNRFQLNFRNHRKIVVVDGRAAFVGGLNVGDEYMGWGSKFGHWRDTHVEMTGPSVHAVQLVFLEDWFWATGQTPELDWEPQGSDAGDQQVLVFPSSPGDLLETCAMFFIHAINSAKRRLWIASPYFVPDNHVMAALQLAALRGVDVRVMLPDKADHLLVYLSGFSFLEEAELAGVKIYRYQPGFMHNKVLLVDKDLSAVGTANLDNRSFRLNFEIMIVVEDRAFAAEVEEMLTRDFANCVRARPDDFQTRPFWFRLAVRVARLMAPVQ